MYAYAKSLLNEGNGVRAKEYMLDAIKHVDDSIENIDATNPRALHLRCDLGNALGGQSSFLQFCYGGQSSEEIKQWP